MANDGVYNSLPATVTLNVEDTLFPSAEHALSPTVQPTPTRSSPAAARPGRLLPTACSPTHPTLTQLQPDRRRCIPTPPTARSRLGSDGSFTYTPNAGITGLDTFTYTVSDGVYISAPATVDINVDNDELPVPDTGAAYAYAVPPGQVLTTSSSDGVLSRATDPYGYSLTAVPGLIAQ